MKLNLLTTNLITLALCAGLFGCQSGNQGEQNTAGNTSSSPVTSSPGSSNTSVPGNKTSAKATKIAVTEKEMAIDLSSKTAPAGPINFDVKNVGKVPHELVVFKTDLPIDKLPLKEDKLNEEEPGLKNVADTGDNYLKSGEERVLHANLAPGKYVLICNVGKHFKLGMKTPFTVQ